MTEKMIDVTSCLGLNFKMGEVAKRLHNEDVLDSWYLHHEDCLYHMNGK